MELQKIGQYLVDRQIAEGGQAKIYKAYKDNVPYAVKVYHSSVESQNHQFLYEKQLMEYLKHKAILSPLHYTLNETVTLASKMDCQKNVAVMRYMKNGDLMNFVIKYGQIDSKVVVRLVRSICQSLQHLSSQNLYHCDIKPENILFGENYEPLLIDFGFISSQSSTRQKDFPKQYYIAPQVKKGQKYNEKSQAFSLGVLSFILLMGRIPFKNTKHTDPSFRSLLQGKHDIFWKQFKQNLNSPLEKKLKEAIIGLMQPNPKRRWGYAQLMESELFNQDLICEKQYFQYFEERLGQKGRTQQNHCQLNLTDYESITSRQIAEENS